MDLLPILILEFDPFLSIDGCPPSTVSASLADDGSEQERAAKAKSTDLCDPWFCPFAQSAAEINGRGGGLLIKARGKLEVGKYICRSRHPLALKRPAPP